MKAFHAPRFDAAELHTYSRARAVERQLRAADRKAATTAALDRGEAFRDRLHRADLVSPAVSPFWILHAR